MYVYSLYINLLVCMCLLSYRLVDATYRAVLAAAEPKWIRLSAAR